MINALNLIKSAGKQSTVLEDAFLLLGTMASCEPHSSPRGQNLTGIVLAIESDMRPYVGPFLEPLLHAIQNTEDSQLCMVAIGTIGDICRALGEEATPYTQGFMTTLYQTLQSTTLNRNVKISVLSCFGDIALATGLGFVPFLDTAMDVLKQAGGLTADEVRRSTSSLTL